MLSTVRARFSLVLLIGISAIAVVAVTSNTDDALAISFVVLIATMLVVERLVINPLVGLTKALVEIADRRPRDLKNRLPVHGSAEFATLAQTFNALIESLAAKQELEGKLVYMAHLSARYAGNCGSLGTVLNPIHAFRLWSPAARPSRLDLKVCHGVAHGFLKLYSPHDGKYGRVFVPGRSS
jgi:hypothetical protein